MEDTKTKKGKRIEKSLDEMFGRPDSDSSNGETIPVKELIANGELKRKMDEYWKTVISESRNFATKLKSHQSTIQELGVLADIGLVSNDEYSNYQLLFEHVKKGPGPGRTYEEFIGNSGAVENLSMTIGMLSLVGMLIFLTSSLAVNPLFALPFFVSAGGLAYSIALDSNPKAPKLFPKFLGNYLYNKAKEKCLSLEDYNGYVAQLHASTSDMLKRIEEGAINKQTFAYHNVMQNGLEERLVRVKEALEKIGEEIKSYKFWNSEFTLNK